VRSVGASEAKNTLASLLDLVENGEEVVITRRGKPVARLVREAGVRDREKARRAADSILANGKGRTLGDFTIRELIDEGRE
jgi:prevent-host-death family protein